MPELTDNSPATVFVLSPIGAAGSIERRNADSALNYIIKKAFAEPLWNVIRADMESAPDSITHQVIERIVEADLIVADLTDQNPNVFYELAVAHAYDKPVIHMCQEGQTVPFDINDQRVAFYDLTDLASADRAITALKASQVWLQEHPDEQRTPLSTFQTFKAISDKSSGGGAAVAEALAQILDRLTAVERAVNRGPVVSVTGSLSGEGSLSAAPSPRSLRWNSNVLRSAKQQDDLLTVLMREAESIQQSINRAEAQDDSTALELLRTELTVANAQIARILWGDVNPPAG